MASPGSVRTLRRYDPYHMAWNTKRAHALGYKPGRGRGGGGTIQGRGIYICHMFIETGALFNIEHYSREGFNRESMVILLFCSYTNKHAPGIS